MPPTLAPRRHLVDRPGESENLSTQQESADLGNGRTGVLGQLIVTSTADGVSYSGKFVVGNTEHAAHQLSCADETRRHDAHGWDT